MVCLVSGDGPFDHISAITGTTVEVCPQTGVNLCRGYGEMHSGISSNPLCDIAGDGFVYGYVG